MARIILINILIVTMDNNLNVCGKITLERNRPKRPNKHKIADVPKRPKNLLSFFSADACAKCVSKSKLQ